MPNTQVGIANMSLASGQQVTFDGLASLISQGSTAAGRAIVQGASAAFPRAASLNNVYDGVYPWGAMLFRFTGAGSAMWTADGVGTPNASIGMPMFNGDPKPIVFPGDVKNFRLAALAAGNLAMVFVQGDAFGL